MRKSTLSTKTVNALDVAKAAGVSRTQVSYVLNNKSLSHVSEENREKILKAAATLGYQPHSSAQALRRGYSKEFSIFFPAPYPGGINRVIGEIHEHGLTDGFVPIQYSFNSYEKRERMQQALQAMLNRKPFGIFCSLFDVERSDIDYMFERGVRKVLVWDIEEHEDLSTLYIPIYEIGRLAARYLKGKGYRRVGFIKPSDPVQKNAFRRKLDGFMEGWEGKDLDEPEILNWPTEFFRPSLASARIFTRELLRKEAIPQAIYAHSDDYALPLLTALREGGLKVPEDIAVMGTDDTAYSEISYPKLTTIKFDSEELGLRVVANINHLILDEPLDDKFRLPPQPVIVEREST